MTSWDERVQRILASAERMAGGDREHRAEISDAHDELDALAFAMNAIVSELSFSARGLARANERAAERNRELTEAQQSLVRQERLATLGQLSGGVAHQIRNPLAAILNAADSRPMFTSLAAVSGSGRRRSQLVQRQYPR